MSSQGIANSFTLDCLEGDDNDYSREEVALARRNHAAQLETLNYDISPTGMHYLLIHFDIPTINQDEYTLDICGLVDKPMKLSMADIKAMPKKSIPVTMECAGNGRTLMKPRYKSAPWGYDAIGTSLWTGVSLVDVLEKAGIKQEAVDVIFTGHDRGIQDGEVQSYQRSLSVAEATFKDVILAYEMNGQDLLPQHGFPLRLIVPGWFGMTSVKWLKSIELVPYVFEGFQMKSYMMTNRDDSPDTPVELMQVRSLMVPPGIPDWYSRSRFIHLSSKPTTIKINGKAWSGRTKISKVEFSTDGGATWNDANIGKSIGEYAWTCWSYDWTINSCGLYRLAVRATDANGKTQPRDPVYNEHGFAINAIQRVDVHVVEELKDGQIVKF